MDRSFELERCNMAGWLAGKLDSESMEMILKIQRQY